MNGLPADFDPGFLVGRFVEEVAFGPYMVIIRFDEQTGIGVESSYLFRESDGDVGTREVAEAQRKSSRLIQIAGKTVTAAFAKTDGTLTLRFDSGAILEIYDSSDSFESYQVWSPNVEVIV